MISSLHAYLPRNRRMIMWVSNNYYRYPIWTFCNWIPVNGYPCDLHVNYACFNGFLRNVSYSFQNCEKRCWRFYSKEVLKRHFLFQNLLQIWLISNNYWTSCGTIQGVIVLQIGLTLHAYPILKLLTPLLPELYSTWSNFHY